MSRTTGTSRGKDLDCPCATDHEGLRHHVAARPSGARADDDCGNEINQATKYVEILQQYIDKVALLPVAMQRQAPRRQFLRSRNKLRKSRRPFLRRISERIVVKTTDVPVPQILKEVAEVVKAVNTASQDRISETICEQIVDALDEPLPPFQEEIYEVIKLPPTERIPERTAEHIVQVPVPQTLEEVAEVVKAVKHAALKRISEEIGEQIYDAPVSHSQPQDFERGRRGGEGSQKCPSGAYFREDW